MSSNQLLVFVIRILKVGLALKGRIFEPHPFGRALQVRALSAKIGADGGNRTRVISLEGWSNTIIRHPRNLLQVT